jgi:hypothetical protein
LPALQGNLLPAVEVRLYAADYRTHAPVRRGVLSTTIYESLGDNQREAPALKTNEEVAGMYGVINTVAAPVEMYDTLHAEILRRVGFIDGLLVHIGRATTDGFQVLEVWESKEHYDRSNTDILFP